MAGTSRVPTKLAQPPLVEAMFEVRFSPKNPSSGDLFPGLLYTRLGEYYKDSTALPVANVPRDIRASDPNLRYLPSHSFSGLDRAIMFGDRVATLGSHGPYEGWLTFRRHVREFVEALQATDLLGETERYSMKAANVLPTAGKSFLGVLNGRFEIAGQAAPECDRSRCLAT